jgi:hypothetical protein
MTCLKRHAHGGSDTVILRSGSDVYTETSSVLLLLPCLLWPSAGQVMTCLSATLSERRPTSVRRDASVIRAASVQEQPHFGWQPAPHSR